MLLKITLKASVTIPVESTLTAFLEDYLEIILGISLANRKVFDSFFTDHFGNLLGMIFFNQFCLLFIGNYFDIL